MPVSIENLNKEVYDVLRSRGYDPIPLNSKGQQDIDIQESDVFRFTFNENGDEVGTGWVNIEGKEIVFYVGDDLTDNDSFLNFLQFMKRWSQRKLLGFKITNKDHLTSDMKKRTSMKNKEQLGEGYYPMGKKASYNDSVPQVKIILQHTRQIEEGEQRFRNVAKIFVENTNGERFLLPTNRPGLARVYARHIAEGGTPYDDKARHITTLVEEYTKMAGFVRATKNSQFNESAQRLVNEGLSHYQNLRETLTRMASRRGYTKYFENYTPVLNEESEDNSSLNELFVQETLDPRIESVMPILKRLSKNITEMSEVNELAEWADSLTEVEDETTKTLAEPAEEMLDEAEKPKVQMDKRGGGVIYNAFKLAKAPKPWLGLAKPKNQQEYDAIEKYRKDAEKPKVQMDKRGGGVIYNVFKDDVAENLDEAPGSMTLKHNQNTEKSNLKAFDLAEDRNHPAVSAITNRILRSHTDLLAKYGPGKVLAAIEDATAGLGELEEIGSSDVSIWVNQIIKSLESGAYDHLKEGFSPSEEVADQVEDSLGGSGKLTSDDLYRAVEEYQEMMDSPHKLDVDEVVQILMDRFHSKGIMVPDISEDLDANQKRAGQLGPTEPVGKNEKNLRGKLVGASESVELDKLKTLSGIK